MNRTETSQASEAQREQDRLNMCVYAENRVSTSSLWNNTRDNGNIKDCNKQSDEEKATSHSCYL